MHKHHIVFKSHGGLDFPLNFKFLTYEQHEGIEGPHRNRDVDLEYKVELQEKLQEIFQEDKLYSIEEIAKSLEKSKQYFAKNFKRVPRVAEKYLGKDVVRHLMGGKFYEKGQTHAENRTYI